MAVDELRVEVVVEVPRGGRNKYEWDARRGVVVFDRRIVGAVAFPADYGFIPGTQACDGDPLDALVLLDEPTYPGVHVPCRVLGAVLIRAGDNAPEPKLICVALGDPAFAEVHHLTDLPGHLVSEVEQFFAVYKELQDSPTPTLAGRLEVDAVRKLLGGTAQ